MYIIHIFLLEDCNITHILSIGIHNSYNFCWIVFIDIHDSYNFSWSMLHMISLWVFHNISTAFLWQSFKFLLKSICLRCWQYLTPMSLAIDDLMIKILSRYFYVNCDSNIPVWAYICTYHYNYIVNWWNCNFLCKSKFPLNKIWTVSPRLHVRLLPDRVCSYLDIPLQPYGVDKVLMEYVNDYFIT